MGGAAALHGMIAVLQQVEELQESLASWRATATSARDIADSLEHLEKVLKHLLAQKNSSPPGTVAHDKAKEQLARMAAVAQEFAYRSER